MDASKIDLKTYSYVEKLVTQQSFKQCIKRIRKRHNIPPRGFDIREYDKLVLNEKNPRIPKIVSDKPFLKAVKRLLNRRGLSSDWVEFFSDYILFGYFGIYSMNNQIIALDIGSKSCEQRRAIEIFNDAKCHNLNPVAIFLPPNLTRREIDNFLDQNFSRIVRMQKKYIQGRQITSTRTKNSSIRLRDAFIHKHRNRPMNQLVSMIASEFGQIMEYTQINKIKRDEAKKKSAGI